MCVIQNQHWVSFSASLFVEMDITLCTALTTSYVKQEHGGSRTNENEEYRTTESNSILKHKA